MKIDKDNLCVFGSIVLVLLLLLAFIYFLGFSRHEEEQNTSGEGVHAKEFEYKGHQYIWFYTNAVAGPDEIIHNPDCKCGR